MTKAHDWLRFARDDLRSAEVLLREGIYHYACFHGQQGVEKALKGFLRSRQRSVPQTHLLGELLNACIKHDQAFSSLRQDCLRLDKYYIPTRYPDALPGAFPEGLPNDEDARQAITILKKVLEFVEGRLGETGEVA